jgi:peptide/nickel transport system ATP-binding protein
MLVEARHLSLDVPDMGQQALFGRRRLRILKGVSVTIDRGETVGVVGESGSGKTSLGRMMLRLYEPAEGTLHFDGTDITHMGPAALKPLRRRMQMIFQDPYASLNPRMRVRDIIAEGMSALGILDSESALEARLDEILGQVGLQAEMKWRYPHEFSGGQRQRIAIARALAVEPKLIVCDEPTSALDVSVQAQILNLLRDLQSRLGLAYLFITHNIAVVEYLAHEVAVMYLGRIVERGRVDEVLTKPAHPYTQALLSAVPQVDPSRKAQVIRLKGELPSPVNPPRGCHFHPRCPAVMERCRGEYPAARTLPSGQVVHCHLY